MTEPTKPTTGTKQYRLDVLGGRAISALTDGLAAKDEDAFYELKDELEEALGNWADKNWPLGEAEEATPAERSKINLETGPKKHG